MALQIPAVVVLGLMCGSELNVAAFAHPTLKRMPVETHAARLRMAGSTLLNLLLLLPIVHLDKSAWQLAAIAGAIQVAAVVFSLVGPVPINNRIAKWTPETVPADCVAQEDRWDLYHWVRTVGWVIGLAALVGSVGMRRHDVSCFYALAEA